MKLIIRHTVFKNFWKKCLGALAFGLLAVAVRRLVRDESGDLTGTFAITSLIAIATVVIADITYAMFAAFGFRLYTKQFDITFDELMEAVHVLELKEQRGWTTWNAKQFRTWHIAAKALHKVAT